MVYDWEDKEDLCYRMYIEEKKSLEEIMDYMKVEHKFAPSKRAFQTQFKRWEFPSKQHPAHKNAQLVERVKELWERNTSQREMLRILNDEDGFDIKERELMRVRAKNRWLLRVPNGMKTTKKRDSDPDQEVLSQIQQALYPNGSMVEEPEMMEETPQSMVVAPTRGESPPLSPEVMQKRQDRLAKLQAESAERWNTRKRRRRTRGWAGLPADPPGPPRFPSETTIDESKAFLSLDSNMYRDVRNRFQRICEDCGIIKKTIAGPERWEAAKNSLIQESEHLQAVFWHDTDNIDQKKLALDVVCSDVTKRMRTLERRMTIAEAKNALGVNPEESRQLRNAFYQTLKADHFTSKLEAGEEHWKELKASWIENSELLKSILAPGDADPQHATKVKAMEVLCRDVMKRLRDDQTKRDPTRKKKLDPKQAAQVNQASYSTSQSAMSPMSPYEQQNNAFQTTPHAALIQTAAHAQAQVQPQAQPQQHIPHLQPPHMHHPHSQSQVQAHGQVTVDPGNMQIDPSLLVAATNDPSILHRQRHFSEQQYAGQQYAPQPSFTPSASVAVYFRLHPSSDYQPNSRLWTGILHSFSINELRRAATANLPATVVAFRIEGLLTEPDGNEASLPIDQDDELTHYLTSVPKAVFVVQLVSSWKND